MRINEEEKQRIRNLHNLNEQKHISEYDFDNTFDNKNNDDYRMDEEVEKMFFSCLDQIEEMRGGKMGKSVFIEMLDKYYDDEPETPEEELPFE